MDRGTCRACGVAMIWIKNENGKSEPFDAKPARILKVAGDPEPAGQNPFTGFDSAAGERLYQQIQTGHLPHFVTCPKASQFKKDESKKAPVPGDLVECSICGSTMARRIAKWQGGKPICVPCLAVPS